MKRKSVERVERRRALVQLNLIEETKARTGSSRRGCASLLTRVLVDAALLVLLVAGLR